MPVSITTPSSSYWQRAIIFIDMNAFFASIEQIDQPSLQGQPVAITNGEQGTCIITCSYEARAYGIKTGMRLFEGRQRCPHLVQCPARPKRYAQVSTQIMQALTDITPDVEVFSVDEAFLDVSRCQLLHGDPAKIARMAKAKVFAASGLHCSIGVSGDKTTAKYAGKLFKPNGFSVIPPWQARERLKNVPVTELCGIAKGIGRFLAQYGVVTCGDMAKLPISVLGKRFGNLGRRIWYMSQGADPTAVITTVSQPKSMGHGKVMPPNTCDRVVILTYLQHMCEKLAARLRKHHFVAQYFFIGLRQSHVGWLGGKYKTQLPTQDGQVIFKLCQYFLKQLWSGEGVGQVQVTALDPKSDQQFDLFADHQAIRTRRRYFKAVDGINHRFGEFTVMPGNLLLRSKMPNVIAPAWKPYGHRETIS